MLTPSGSKEFLAAEEASAATTSEGLKSLGAGSFHCRACRGRTPSAACFLAKKFRSAVAICRRPETPSTEFVAGLEGLASFSTAHGFLRASRSRRDPRSAAMDAFAFPAVSFAFAMDSGVFAAMATLAAARASLFSFLVSLEPQRVLDVAARRS